MSKTNIYVVYDKIADETVILAPCKTDGLFVRQNTPYLSKINPNYLFDMVIYQVGEYLESGKLLVPCKPRLVDWDSYKNPEQSEGKLNIVQHV